MRKYKEGAAMTQEGNEKKDEKIIVHVDEEIEDLIPGFLENRRNDVKTIEEALDKGDYETIRVLGHKMKGTGGGYGFDAITDLGHSFENAGDEKDSEEIRRLVNELSHYLEHVEVICE